MSQGSNFKKEVMEALFNAPTNQVNNKMIMWAASNLPDEGGMGTNTTQLRAEYNHELNSFWSAIGMPGEDMEGIHNKVRDQLFSYVKKADSDTLKKSMVFQHLEKTLGMECIMYFAAHGFMKHYEAMQESQVAGAMGDMLGMSGSDADMDQLKTIIEMLKKLKGGDK